MKIEQKHGVNKPLYAAGAAVVAASTLLCGCNPFVVDYAGDEVMPTTDEVELDGDVIEYTDESSVNVSCSGDCDFDMDQAVKKLQEYCGKFPAGGIQVTSDFDDRYKLLDVTGDGKDDIVTSFTYGSGLVRDTIVVYDATNKVFYQFNNQFDSYHLQSVEDGKMIVEETVYPNKKNMGTVVIEDGYLVFVADEAADETSESAMETSDETSAEVTDEE